MRRPAALATFTLLITVLCADARAAAPGGIIIAAGPVAGFAYPLAGEVCRLFEKESPQTARCAVEPVAGSLEAIERLRAGDADLAVVQSDLAADAVGGHGLFSARQPFPELRSLVGFYADALTVLIRNDSAIRALEDLHGRRVVIGEPGAPDVLFSDLLETIGWTKADFAAVAEIPRPGQIKALCDGTVAAILITTPHPNSFVRQAMAACPVSILDLSGGALESIINAHHAYGPTRINQSVYGGPKRVVESFGPRTILVTTAKADDSLVTTLLAAIFRQVNELKDAHPAFAALDSAIIAASGGLGIDRHPAAIRFFDNNNISSTPTGD